MANTALHTWMARMVGMRSSIQPYTAASSKTAARKQQSTAQHHRLSKHSQDAVPTHKTPRLQLPTV
jgi:hypothetical protein